ncbi:hypothetical protein [Marinilabilia sp.]|uniref:hypothetical protein n=1 Tax=Marinilabilia sp. TaxID=2021252 RepID=UPI0025C58DD4|nr:hypothetical protein [Marinilabilia sp.]
MKNIELGKGVDNIQFGMTREEFKKIMGEPDEIEVMENEDLPEDKSEAWHYDEIELSASFDQMEDWRLTSLAVSSDEYTFEGIDLIGLSQQEVMDQIEMMDLGDISIEELSDEEDNSQQIATLLEVSLNLWFDNGILSEIQWGPYWDDDEEELIWPGEE